MNKKMNFIVTTDEDTARVLTEEGFRLISDNNGQYTFENKPIEFFSEKDVKNVVYTNTLTF